MLKSEIEVDKQITGGSENKHEGASVRLWPGVKAVDTQLGWSSGLELFRLGYVF